MHWESLDCREYLGRSHGSICKEACAGRQAGRRLHQKQGRCCSVAQEGLPEDSPTTPSQGSRAHWALSPVQPCQSVELMWVRLGFPEGTREKHCPARWLRGSLAPSWLCGVSAAPLAGLHGIHHCPPLSSSQIGAEGPLWVRTHHRCHSSPCGTGCHGFHPESVQHSGPTQPRNSSLLPPSSPKPVKITLTEYAYLLSEIGV